MSEFIKNKFLRVTAASSPAKKRSSTYKFLKSNTYVALIRINGRMNT